MRAATTGHGQIALLLCAVSACASSACAGSDEPDAPPKVREPLVLLDAWTSVPRSADPFIAEGDDVPSCAEPPFSIEEAQAWLEIDTTLCPWVTLTQPAQSSVAEGTLLELDFSHFDLDAAEPARATLSLRFDDCEAWSKSIPIPGAARVYAEQFRSPCRLTSTSDVFFHLDNHGQNTYQLKDLLRLE